MNHDVRWQRYYDALLQYTARYGDALVPSGHIEFLDSGEELNLGNWVSYMRTRYRQKALPEQRQILLELIPSWQWGPVRPGPKSRDVVMVRNNEIMSRHSSGGVSLSALAREYGLSRQRIHQIIKENTDA